MNHASDCRCADCIDRENRPRRTNQASGVAERFVLIEVDGMQRDPVFSDKAEALTALAYATCSFSDLSPPWMKNLRTGKRVLPDGSEVDAPLPRRAALAAKPAAPAEVVESDWRIDNSTPSPILVYKNCSVIQDEQAHWALGVIHDALRTPAQAPSTGAVPYLRERLEDHTCKCVEDAGGTPGLTLYLTKLGAHPEFQLYSSEALALWINLGKALGPLATPPVVQPASRHGIAIDFKQATELLEMFGGEPTEITLMTGDGHSGDGLYAVYNADPEGAIYLGKTDEDATPEQPASPAVEVACWACNDTKVVTTSSNGSGLIEAPCACTYEGATLPAPAAVTEGASRREIVDLLTSAAWQLKQHASDCNHVSSRELPGKLIAAATAIAATPHPAVAVPGSLETAREALEEIALAGMSGSGQESEEGMRDWHARRAWEFIGIAARALAALATTSTAAQPEGEK